PPPPWPLCSRHSPSRCARPRLSRSRLGTRRHYRRPSRFAATKPDSHDALRTFPCWTRSQPHRHALHHLARRRHLLSITFRIFPLALRRGGTSFAHAHRSAPFHGTHPIRDGHPHHHPSTPHERRPRLDLPTNQHLCRLRLSRTHLRARHYIRLPRPPLAQHAA